MTSIGGSTQAPPRFYRMKVTGMLVGLPPFRPMKICCGPTGTPLSENRNVIAVAQLALTVKPSRS